MPNNLRNKVEILVFKEGCTGPIAVFKSIKDAADHFNVHRDTIIRKLINGEKLNGCFLDWGFDTPADVISTLETSYTKRFENNSRYCLEFYRSHAAQKEMQNSRL